MVSHNVSLATSIAAITLILLSSIPALRAIFSILATSQNKRGKYSSAEKVYEDEDGVATPETDATFSQKWAKLFITVMTAATFSVNVALAIIDTLDFEKDNEHKKLGMVEVWTGVGGWVSTIFAQLKIRKPIPKQCS